MKTTFCISTQFWLSILLVLIGTPMRVIPKAATPVTIGGHQVLLEVICQPLVSLQAATAPSGASVDKVSLTSITFVTNTFCYTNSITILSNGVVDSNVTVVPIFVETNILCVTNLEAHVRVVSSDIVPFAPATPSNNTVMDWISSLICVTNLTVSTNTPSNTNSSQADLVVTKSISPGTVNGQAFQTFTINIQNLGPDPATNTVVTEFLPGELQLLGHVESVGNWSPATGQWTLGTLQAGASASLAITVISSNAAVVVNTATGSSATSDPNPSNNSGSATGTWLAVGADLWVYKQAFPGETGEGQDILFQVTAGNNGPELAEQVVVTESLPPGLQWVSASPPLGTTWDPAGGLWRIPLLSVGEVRVLELHATTLFAGEFTNRAAISGSKPDSQPANNSALADVKVTNTTFKISGKILQCDSNHTPLADAWVELRTNTSTDRVDLEMTDTNGFYCFSNVVKGTWEIVPITEPWIYAPTSRVVSVTTSNVTADFIAGGYIIHGKVSITNAPVAGVRMDVVGPKTLHVTTEDDGTYIVTNLSDGKWTVTPSRRFLTFTPTNLVVELTKSNCTAIVNFEAAVVNVQLVGLEVNQSVQSLENSVPLVQNKPTLVRAFLQLPFSNSAPVLVKGAQLILKRGVDTKTLDPVNHPGGLLVVTNNGTLTKYRTNIDGSLNFEIPADWRKGAGVSMMFQWTNGLLTCFKYGLLSNCAVTVTFEEMPSLDAKFVFTEWTDSDKKKHGPGSDQLDALKARLNAVYPVASVDAQSMDLVWTIKPPTNSGATNIQYHLGGLNQQIKLLRAKDIGEKASTRIYFGIVVDTKLGGMADRPGKAGVNKTGDVASSQGRPDGMTPAHEIGHLLGREHAVYRDGEKLREGDCKEMAPKGTPDFPFFIGATRGTDKVKLPILGPPDKGAIKWMYGWDSERRRVVDWLKEYELMGYCGVARWGSSYTYTNLMNAIINRFGKGGAPVPASLNLTGDGDWLLFRGIISSGIDSVEWLPTAVTERRPTPDPEPGDWVLRAFGAGGVEIYSTSFTPDSAMAEQDDPDADENGGEEVLSFLLGVPAEPTPVRIELYRGIQQMSVLQASAHAPEILLMSPQPGDHLNSGDLVVRWTSQDADGDSLSFVVQYSPDDGHTWKTLCTDWTLDQFTIPFAKVSASDKARVRVMASDGFRTTVAGMVSAFAVGNHPPNVAIQHPVGGAEISEDQSLLLAAAVTDLDEPEISDDRIRWSSDRLGALGTGRELLVKASEFPEGTHPIQVTATDLAGVSRSATTLLTVWRTTPVRLVVTVEEQVLVFRWAGWAENFALQSRMLEGGVAWTDVGVPGALEDNEYVVRLPLDGGVRFYRLFQAEQP